MTNFSQLIFLATKEKESTNIFEPLFLDGSQPSKNGHENALFELTIWQ